MMIWSGEGSDTTFINELNKAIKYSIITRQVKEVQQSCYLGTTAWARLLRLSSTIKENRTCTTNHVLP